ncbi:MAG: peroxiredoxin [Myxococcota bacterium]
MSLKLGTIAPDFTQNSTIGALNLYEYLGDSWGILFSHPADFTPVCTTELGTVAKYLPEFKQRNVKVLALSVDSVHSHQEWVGDINSSQNTSVNYPIIADEDQTVAELYGMLHPESDTTLTVRSVFIIDPNKKVRLTLTYPASAGRNFDELLRVIDSLQLTEYEKVATPANWTPGQRVVIVPSVTNEEANAKYPQGFETIKPYLRLVELAE